LLPPDSICFFIENFVYTFAVTLILARTTKTGFMFVNNDYFETWMERLSKKLSEIGKDLKSLVNTNDMFDKDEKLLDNQDLCLMFHVSKRTLQRYRSEGLLPFIKYGQKIYYTSRGLK
jgi:hypothetical protein